MTDDDDAIDADHEAQRAREESKRAADFERWLVPIMAAGYTRERAIELLHERMRLRFFEALERERLNGELD